MIILTTLPPSEFTPFISWASQLTQDLADYNIAGPTTEERWVEWAAQLEQIPQLGGLNIPNPMTFADWRRWAGRLISNLG